MAVLPIGIGSATGAGGYQIERSLRFNSADSAYLNRTPGSAGNRKTWTFSAWVKRAKLGGVQVLWEATDASGTTPRATNRFSSDAFVGQDSSSGLDYSTTQLFRDPSAWCHFIIAMDTTQATSSNRFKLYFNGTQVTSFSSITYPTLNSDTLFNSTSYFNYIGANRPAFSQYFDGYLTEINFIDGQALTPSSFGETDSNTGVWKPKAFSGTYGTNGFYLKFADNSGTTSTTLGKDSSGNGNNWTPNNFSVTAGVGNDSLVDSPTSYGTDTGIGGEVRGNYATLNPLAKGAGVVLSDGNLGYTSNATYRVVLGSIAVASGKYYWEVTAPSNAYAFGVADVSYKIFDSSILATGNLFSYSSFSGDKYIGLSFTQSSYDTSGGISTSTVLGFAVDFDTGTATIYRNGVSKGVIHTWTPGATYAPFAGYDTTPSGVAYFNFGQRAFAYTAPSGFKALCTQNLPTPAIGATSTTQANDYMNVVLYSGNSSTQAITGVGFQPDFVWCKGRSTGGHHIVTDAVRTAAKVLSTSQTAAESAWSDNGFFQSLNSDGFTLTGGGTGINTTGNTYVAWNWKANGAGSSNTAGTITSTVSANTTSGFSIVTYTGTGANATVGHGLGVAPSLIITKERNTAVGNWNSYHASLGRSAYISLNTTNASNTSSNYWGTADPTSTVFGLGTAGNNTNTTTYVAYCFAPVAGYSAFGSYTGNGSADGPFIYTGFKPNFVMVKQTNTSGNSWWMFDGVRSTTNAVYNRLAANLSDAEYSNSSTFDFLSNGFKLRFSDTAWNGSGSTYIYAAFAESPFKYSLAR